MEGSVVAPLCKCKSPLPAIVFTSSTTKNPDRKFWGCERWESGGSCRFFRWLTPRQVAWHDAMEAAEGGGGGRGGRGGRGRRGGYGGRDAAPRVGLAGGRVAGGLAGGRNDPPRVGLVGGRGAAPTAALVGGRNGPPRIGLAGGRSRPPRPEGRGGDNVIHVAVPEVRNVAVPEMKNFAVPDYSRARTAGSSGSKSYDCATGKQIECPVSAASSSVKLIVHYGGFFRGGNFPMNYTSGRSDVLEIDIDHLSWFEIRGMLANNLGIDVVSDVMRIQHYVSDLGLMLLYDDNTVSEMLNMHPMGEAIDIYVCHNRFPNVEDLVGTSGSAAMAEGHGVSNGEDESEKQYNPPEEFDSSSSDDVQAVVIDDVEIAKERSLTTGELLQYLTDDEDELRTFTHRAKEYSAQKQRQPHVEPLGTNIVTSRPILVLAELPEQSA